MARNSRSGGKTTPEHPVAVYREAINRSGFVFRKRRFIRVQNKNNTDIYRWRRPNGIETVQRSWPTVGAGSITGSIPGPHARSMAFYVRRRGPFDRAGGVGVRRRMSRRRVTDTTGGRRQTMGGLGGRFGGVE